MDTPTQDIPKVEAIYTTEDIIKQVESSGINLGDDPKARVNTFIDAGLLPPAQNGHFPSWAVQRIIAIQDKLMEGKSLAALKEETARERRRFLNQVTDLDSMAKLYKKFSSNSMFMLASSLLLIFISLGFVANMLAPGNPVIVAGKNTVKKAMETGGDIAKRAVSPVGKTLVMIIQTSKPEDSKSADPLGLTNLEIDTPVIPDNLVQIDNNGNLIIKGKISALDFSGNGENLTDLLWSSITKRPKVLSAIDGVSSDEGEIDLVAGTGISISSDDSLDTITISNIDLGSSQAIFKNIAVSGQNSLIADSNFDILTFSAGTNINFSTNPTTDSITISASASISDATTLDSLDSLQFLRSDTSDSFTSGTLTTNAGTTLDIDGTLAWGGATISQGLNMNNQIISNIGAAGTDFTATGGLNIADDLVVTDKTALGSSAVINNGTILLLDDTLNAGVSNGIRIDLNTTSAIAALTGIWSNPTYSATGAGGMLVYGGFFDSEYNSSFALSSLVGIRAELSSTAAGTGLINTGTGIEVRSSWQGSSPGATTGIIIYDVSGADTTFAYGLRIGSIGNGTSRYPIYQTGVTSQENVFLAATSGFGRDPTGDDTSYKVVIQGALCVDDGTANCPAGPTSGAIYVENSVGAGNVSAFDIAEYYPATEAVGKGDVLTIAASGDSRVSKSSKPYDPALIGVVSTDPAAVIDATNITFGKTAGDKFNPLKPYVALAGRAPVKVSTENGSIEPGDPLTSSSTPGVAMKATSSGPIIGKALESYGGSGIGTIMVFVSTSWYVAPLTSPPAGGSDLSNITNLNVENLTSNIVNTQVLLIGNTKLSMVKNGALKIEGDVEVNGNLVAARVTTDELVVSDKTSGSDVVEAGQKSVTIGNDKVSERSKVLVTFADNYSPATRFWITKKAGESFTLQLDQPISANVGFDWLIVN